jgi:tetrahydromethanopterin S-methyltransferase subunit F
MNDKYTELILKKERKDKIEISFVGEREYLYSGWEINQITSHINNVYYKNELINTLKSRLNSGVNPSHIIIMDESIKLNNTYEKYKNGVLNLSDEIDLIEYYYLGSPIPLEPNTQIYKMNILFDLARGLYSSTVNTKVTPISRKFLVHTLMQTQKNIETSEKLKKLLYKMLVTTNQETIMKDKTINNSIQKIIEKQKKHYRLWDEVNAHESDINTFAEKEDLIKKFHYTFKRFEKPILCIYNEKDNAIELLCVDMIVRSYFKEKNARLLETKEIKQNSPLIITIGIAIGFLPTIIMLGESLNNARKTKKNYSEQFLQIKQEEEKIIQEKKDSEDRIEKNKAILASIKEVNESISSDNSSKSNELVAIEVVTEMEEEVTTSLEKLLIRKDIKISNTEVFN